ncbi:hypothetical protein DKM44_01380 [Deinococcus irradiatisoli]|uniref:Uncharacterized protein n=1 Tax=Deinococcus irradiatisoli TaxID=2202254 RepID=A0A2Z3JLB3_9DEIO|nr:hypothetical protein [Deinococcus irradiatisoli]AWN22054.1 hypothetical protein DKM44_01380 [Deinococcus irradiatisoli]
MNLEQYRHPGAPRFKLYASLYAALVLSAVLGGKRPGEVGTVQTLRSSSFARIMFMDIGMLSTLGALYLMLTGKTRARLPGAAATLFAGSFALIPALAWEDWAALRRGRQE